MFGEEDIYEAEEDRDSPFYDEDEEDAPDEYEPPRASEPEPGEEAGGDEEPEGEPEEDDGRRWYVVHCYSGYENKVRHAIEQRIETMGMDDKIFDVIVPTEEEIEIKEGKRRVVERRVFPGYVLVQMIMDEDSWYVVRNTPGVTGFVGMGNKPTPLTEQEVQSQLQTPRQQQGRARMPSFAFITEVERQALLTFLLRPDCPRDGAGFGNRSK